jgi:hypothetical protein
MQGRFRDLFTRQLEKALLKTSLSYRELAGDGFQLQHSLKVRVWGGNCLLLAPCCACDRQELQVSCMP